MSIYTLGITIGGGAALMLGGSVVAAIARAGAQSLPQWNTMFCGIQTIQSAVF